LKKFLCFIIMAVFLIGNCLPVYADGIGDEQCSDYPGVIDYRQHDIGLTPSHQKPSAKFSLQIKDAAGNLRTEAISPGGTYLANNPIASSQDSPVINASIGDSIVINNLSTKGSGNSINKYDIQYRFVPKGSNREDCQIHSQIVNSFNSAKNIIENLKIENEGAFEIYLCVADNASCLPGATNWSANGNIRSINTSNPNFPNGIFWYFTGAVVEVGGEAPDFFPTPEGSNQWREEYKDPNKGAKTYTYKQGATEITFPVTLRNAGEKAITDFRAVWFGQGNDPVMGWQGSNPPWKSDPAEIKLDKNGEQTFTVTIPLPVPEASKGLIAFKANVDGKTPANETNQDNNLMFVKIQPEGVDIQVDLSDLPFVYYINPGEVADVYVPLLILRNDRNSMPLNPVDIDVNYSGPFGQVNKQDTIGDNVICYELKFKLNKAGTYKIRAEAWPIGATDINPANNKDEATVIVKLKKKSDAQKINPDSQTRVNLRS